MGKATDFPPNCIILNDRTELEAVTLKSSCELFIIYLPRVHGVGQKRGIQR